MAAKSFKPLIIGVLLLSLTSMLLLPGLSKFDVEDYRSETPQFDPYIFFNGRIEAWGVVQDWRQRVTRRFYVDITGTLEDDEIVLDEQFVFNDGEESSREWRISRTEDGEISARANDILGAATGELAGNAMTLNYTMDLPVGDKSYRVQFNDALWQVDERVLFNRARIKKFGMTVGEVSLFMRKLD